MGTVVKGTVFILQSRHHGSNQQLAAIAKSIFPEHTVMRQRFELRSRSKLFRLFCRLLVRLKRSTGGIRPFAAVLSWLALRHGYVRVTDRDVIIAKTPPFEYPAMILGAGTGARTVFLGAPRHFSTRDFDTVVSTPSTFCADADIVLETLPTEVYGAPAKATMPDRDFNACLVVDRGGRCQRLSLRGGIFPVALPGNGAALPERWGYNGSSVPRPEPVPRRRRP